MVCLKAFFHKPRLRKHYIRTTFAFINPISVWEGEGGGHRMHPYSSYPQKFSPHLLSCLEFLYSHLTPEKMSHIPASKQSFENANNKSYNQISSCVLINRFLTGFLEMLMMAFFAFCVFINPQ